MSCYNIPKNLEFSTAGRIRREHFIKGNERLKDWKKKIGHAAFYGEERHTYLRAGGNIYTLQQILGHASIKTTELYLDHLTPDEKHTAKYGAGTKVGTDTTV